MSTAAIVRPRSDLGRASDQREQARLYESEASRTRSEGSISSEPTVILGRPAEELCFCLRDKVLIEVQPEYGDSDRIPILQRLA